MLRSNDRQVSRRAIVGLTAASLLLCSGAACGSSGSDEPWAQELAAAQEEADSAFEQAVFEDMRIERREYDEAVDRFVDCMERNGHQVEAVLGAGGFYSFQSSVSADSVFSACQEGTTRFIEPLYVGIAQNPSQEDIFELNARCLVQLGVAPAGYDGDEFRRAYETETLSPTIDTSNPNFARCMVNPSSP